MDLVQEYRDAAQQCVEMGLATNNAHWHWLAARWICCAEAIEATERWRELEREAA